jgi:hypothetical protein
VKKTSSGSESFYLEKDELLRRLGISLVPSHQGELVSVSLALEPGQSSLTITINRSLPEIVVPEQAHHRGLGDLIGPVEGQ